MVYCEGKKILYFLIIIVNLIKNVNYLGEFASDKVPNVLELFIKCLHFAILFLFWWWYSSLKLWVVDRMILEPISKKIFSIQEFATLVTAGPLRYLETTYPKRFMIT